MSAFGKRNGGGRRSTARTGTPLSGLVATTLGTRLAVVLDVSATGARVRGNDLPRKWAELFVNVEGVVSFATVRWEDGDERGLEFDTPLHPGDEDFLQQKVREAKGMSPDLMAANEWARGLSR